MSIFKTIFILVYAFFCNFGNFIFLNKFGRGKIFQFTWFKKKNSKIDVGKKKSHIVTYGVKDNKVFF